MRPTKQASSFRLVVCGILLISLLWPTLLAAAPPRSNRRVALQRKRASIQSQIRAKRAKLSQVKVKERKTAVRLRGVEHQLRIARGELQAATLRLKRTQSELRKANLALSGAKRQFSTSQQDVGTRLVALYERGDQGYMDLMLTADDFGDVLQRTQVANLLMEQDREALQDLKERKDRVARYQSVVERKKEAVAEARQDVAVKHNRVDVERRQVAHNLSNVREMRSDMEAELAALERDSAAVSAMIRRLQSSARGRKRYNTVYVGRVGGLPVRGRITSGFGYRYHPVLHYRRLHTGVDIAAPTGTPITAAGGGEVIYAGRRGGYGNTVIIDHGGGKATLYGHMSSIAVGAGQVVRRGQMVGRVGSTGISTGPHLHYEVRMNGSPVSPL